MSQLLKDRQIFLVGGAVRDELLGLEVHDRDYVVVGSRPEELEQAGFIQVGRDFPVFLHPETKEEYALARTESKSGVGYSGFICDFNPAVTLEEDLARRDLTINAIAKDETGQFIDPYNGQQDIKHKILRHISPAFSEDPLRVLRVARFAARFAHLGFSVHPDTMALMQTLSGSGELEALTAERVWQETLKALSEKTPSVYVATLQNSGALSTLMPELAALFGVPQTAKYHPEVDTGLHLLMTLDAARTHFNDPMITFAVLLHDLGKGITPEDQWPRHINHEVTGVPLVEAFCRRFKVPKAYQDLAKLVCEFHLKCHRVSEMKPASIHKLIKALDGFRRPQRVGQFAAACEADSRGRLGFEQSAYPQREMLLQCLQVAKSVQTQPLLEKGYTGVELAMQIEKQQIAAIKNYRCR